jgi:hypothetical protein
MPANTLDPTCCRTSAQIEAARRNGALSRGPVTPEGKARSARNATRHGLCAKTVVHGDGEGGDAAALAALRGALLARHLPRDAAEAHWVEELAFAAWRQRRLRTLEAEVLARVGAGGEAPSPALPSLSTLIRYRARLDRDWRRAGEELEALRRNRAVPPSPAQLRLAADLIEQSQAAAADGATEEKHTNENRARGTNEPDPPPKTDEPARRGGGTNEPVPAAPICMKEMVARRTDEPRHPVPPLPETRTDEPDERPVPPPLSRHQRRRLAAAIARRGLRPAA